MVLWLAIRFAVGATISTHDTGPPIGPTKTQFNLNAVFLDSALFPARPILDSARFGESPLPDRNQSHHAMTCFFGAPDDKLFVILNHFSNKLISTIGALIGAWLLCCSHNSGIKESSNPCNSRWRRRLGRWKLPLPAPRPVPCLAPDTPQKAAA